MNRERSNVGSVASISPACCACVMTIAMRRVASSRCSPIRFFRAGVPNDVLDTCAVVTELVKKAYGRMQKRFPGCISAWQWASMDSLKWIRLCGRLCRWSQI
jgi:hypothetical protein